MSNAGFFRPRCAGEVDKKPTTGTTLQSPSFTREQAHRGSLLYAQRCAACHGRALDDGEFAPTIKGEAFLRRWGGRSAAQLFDYIQSNMPTSAPGSLTPNETADIL